MLENTEIDRLVRLMGESLMHANHIKETEEMIAVVQLVSSTLQAFHNIAWSLLEINERQQNV